MGERKKYDREYFERWYHEPTSRIHARGELTRRVRMVVGIAEFLLRRPVRSVLDVGCGEGAWQPALATVRPGASYLGIDSSEYAISRYGKERNLRSGTFGSLAAMELDGGFDLIVSSDVMHYLDAREISAGLAEIERLLDGVAYLALFSREDDPDGDLEGWRARPAKWYREKITRSGLVPVGMQCYIGSALAGSPSSLEYCG